MFRHQNGGQNYKTADDSFEYVEELKILERHQRNQSYRHK
jgi:hypothetical protein